ncbi:MAG: antitoxin [Candidatus Hydrogenedentes bacterium CG07_land_8_20_14_0_80_42_17]|nr:MAG: hypothetical protein AUJ18_10260 [Candidatus Hydrogenedentes bacterium CG1_02_42_14]PIU46760.1 MAG: antitoxin [Candidatus Hydrogenedentes bacterium CG07_land_8_20_14_0_80_42_17]
MVDVDLIKKKLVQLREYKKQINEFKNITLNQYTNDWKTQRTIERTLQIMVESCLDIANHIISDSSFRLPNNSADTFRILSENKILPNKLMNELIRMVQFRNFIVHNYERIDGSIVTNILKKKLIVFDKFSLQIIKYLKFK